MKITKVEKTQTFQPIQITISIEEKRDLEFLWALLGGSMNDTTLFVNNVLKSCSNFKDIKPFHYSEVEKTHVWDVIDETLKSINK